MAIQAKVTIAALVAFLLLAGAAGAALVRVNGIVLRADGGFTPHVLPRKTFAPIDFQGRADISAVGGGMPSALQHVTLNFDRDGRLTTAGLPVCPASKVAAAAPAQARARCAGAIVGKGNVEALVGLDGQRPVRASSLLTLFNGPRQEGHPTVVFHAQMTRPALQTFAIVVPVERRSGDFAYRATLELPAIAGGRGALTHVDVEIGRRYRAGGAERSYVSARCSDNVLETRGNFTFADGTVIEGSVMKPCVFR